MATKNPCDLLRCLIEEPTERDWLEFKVNNDNPEEIGEYISALANSAMLADRDRAYLVFGVENSGRKIVGTSVRLGTMKGKGNEGLQNWLDRNLSPKLFLEYLDFDCDGKSISIICVEPTYDRPVTFKNVAYIRIGEHKKKLAEHHAHERSLWLATNRRKFEDGIAATHLTAEQILEHLDSSAFYKLSGIPKPKAPTEVLTKMEEHGFIKANMENSYDILNLGAILLARNVQQFPTIRAKTIRVIKYKGKNKKTSEPEQEGQLGYAVGFKGLIKFIMQRSTEEVYEGGVRTLVPLCPEIAVREVVANALIHQDFTNSGAGPVVEIYSDRIEIINPGNSLIETDRMIDARKSRNEKLASAMRTLGLCEERGGGLDKALIAVEDDHLPAPAFFPSVDSMRVVLFGYKPFKKMTTEEKQRACFFHCIIKWLTHDNMSNGSLRKRFDLSSEEYQAASAIITAMVRKGRILPAEPGQGRRTAKYVPYFA